MKSSIAFEDQLLLTDGGLETTLIYQYGIDLPHFAAFVLLKDEHGKQQLRQYYERYLELAAKYKKGFILESPTWRASTDWAYKLGFSKTELQALNIAAINELKNLRRAYKDKIPSIVISGCVGPRGDGYSPGDKMNVAEAATYHEPQIHAFQMVGVDLVTAMTITYREEAIGIVRAAQLQELPVVISFTLETDGKLPDGVSLRDAIQIVDDYTDGYPLHYMINCAHPSHFCDVLVSNDHWVKRIQGIRANASRKSHEELDNSDHLDIGDKEELARQYQALRTLLPQLKVVGGCCGTDHRHIESICGVWEAEHKPA